MQNQHLIKRLASFCVELISKMALKAKSSEFRRETADGASRLAGTPRVSTAAGTIRTESTMSHDDAAEQKFADWSPNAFLRLALILFLIILIFFAMRKSDYALPARPLSSDRFAALRMGISPTPSLTPLVRNLPPAPSVQAHSFLVQIIGEDAPLIGKRTNKQLALASITKLFTSLVALEELGPDDTIEISEDAKRLGEKISPLPPDTKIRRDDAIRLAVVMSANDAAAALVDRIGRKEGALNFRDAQQMFSKRANARAAELGMRDSHFQNPTGLDDPDQYTTAHDLFLLASYLWNTHPRLWEWTRDVKTTISSIDGHPWNIENTNDLLKEFPALVGSKTGLTDAAKGTLLMLYPAGERAMAVIVILGSPQRFEDGRALIQWLQEAMQ